MILTFFKLTHDVRQLRFINAYTRHLKSGFTEMVKLAQWSNNYYFYIQQTEAYSVTHIKHSQQVLPKCYQQHG